ncbi:MAG: TldD/PmbA family protein [Candidatus Bathyarchaeota archaeon]|nr:TldD/PmbA family protein [Candidatus Bathyarchaeota archaeon]MDW8040732.1 TldD/PmbA family protein [Nitrososphaerota archaeon]
MAVELLKDCIKDFHKGYVELRYHQRRSFNVSVKDGKIDTLNNGAVEGVCARVLIDGSWGFASTTVLGKEKIRKMLDNATSLAEASKPVKKRPASLAFIKPCIDKYETPMKRDPRKADKEELVSLVLDVDKTVRDYSKTIVSDTVTFNVVDDNIAFVNSEGSEIRQRIVRCFGNVTVIAREKGNITSAYEGIGEQSGLEILEKTPLMNAGLIAAERASKLVSAKMAPAGYFPVILENRIVGLLAHEAVGHCAEADLVFGGSFLANKIGEKVASEKVTLVDDGRFPNGFGTMMYDDEGVPTQKTVIIEKGVCKSFLHSRETAQHFGVNPTGNARAWTFEFDPIIRMRNTYIEVGDHTLEELAEDIKEGFFLKGGLSGQADFNGEFMFGTQEAIRIKNGKLAEALRGITISGNSFEVLKNVDAIGKDFVMRVGLCGKEQVNYVGMGGASLRTKVLMGGAK